jgi:hypothetical protein
VLRPSSTAEKDIVECFLVHTSLDDSVTYIALSYTWGKPDPDDPVPCEEWEREEYPILLNREEIQYPAQSVQCALSLSTTYWIYDSVG